MMTNPNILRGFVSLLLLIRWCHGFYVAGVAPVNYCPKTDDKDTCKREIYVYVNRLASAESVFPYEYEHFDFCQSQGSSSSPTENLGQVVFGERIRPSAYKFYFKENKVGYACQTKVYLDKTDDKPRFESDKKKIETLWQAIRLNYQHHWIIDNMPVASCYVTDDQSKSKNICYPSFPVGCYVDKNLKGKDDCHSLLPKDSLKPDTAYLFNHVELVIDYHPWSADWPGNPPQSAGRLLKATVSSLASIDFKSSDNIEKEISPRSPPLILPGPKETPKKLSISYTYSVTFKENKEVKWSSRWDYILESVPNASIVWLSIINSVVIIVVLSGLLSWILLRTLRRNFDNCNQLDNSKGAVKEFGWKLVHGDVFRTPRKGMLLSVFLGSGVQIFFMTLITLIFACLGVLSPANRGALMTCALVSYVCLGTPAGFVSSAIYKFFGGENWKINIILTTCLCPGIVYGAAFILNLFFWIVGSSAAMPVSTLVALLALWFGVSAPLTFVGAYFGLKKVIIKPPIPTNEIPRQIPNQPFCRKPLIGIILSGILPFGCIFIQLFFILNSVWSHQLYYMFGYLFLVFLILIITCSETAILSCYFHLSAEDYHWWWRSFLTSGFTAFYFFLYSINYYVSQLEMEGFLNAFFYFGFTLIMTFLVFLLTGTIGFFACLWFLTKIYGTFRVEVPFHETVKTLPFEENIGNIQKSSMELAGVFGSDIQKSSVELADVFGSDIQKSSVYM